MWLSVLLAWIGVRWYAGGMTWVWVSFVLTSIPASILMYVVVRRRIEDFEHGRRAMPEDRRRADSLTNLLAGRASAASPPAIRNVAPCTEHWVNVALA